MQSWLLLYSISELTLKSILFAEQLHKYLYLASFLIYVHTAVWFVKYQHALLLNVAIVKH